MLLLLLIVLSLQAPAACPDAAACRAEAEAAAARGEYESFHDLAWRAVQKGKPNDPALMFLLARAQSLSGRPGDALVMLGRLADMHVMLDLSLPDFDRARRLPGWEALAARITGSGAPGAPAPGAPDAPAPRVPHAPRAPGAPDAPDAPDVPAPRAPDAPRAPRAGDEAVSFEPPSGLAPFALAHDAVSRRFVIGDAPSRRLLVVDEVSTHVVPYVSAASAGFYDELTAMAVDARRGDLWVTSVTGAGAESTSIVHKLQLVSGRGLMEVRPAESLSPVRLVDIAVDADGTVLALDAAGGRVLRLRPGGKTLEVAVKFEAPGARALAVADERTAFVATASGVLRVDLGSRSAQPIKAPDDLAGFISLAWRNGALVGVQHAAGASVVARVALDASGTRAQPRAILAASPSAIVGALAENRFYYLVDGVIKRIALR